MIFKDNSIRHDILLSLVQFRLCNRRVPKEASPRASCPSSVFPNVRLNNLAGAEEFVVCVTQADIRFGRTGNVFNSLEASL